MLEIIPAILTLNKNELEEKISLLSDVSDIVKRVQIDIVDGKFAKNKTIEPDVIGELDVDQLVDFHLMTKEPVDWVERCARGMSDRIIGHIEMMSSQVKFVGRVQELGFKVGLAVDIDTSLSEIDPVILRDLDVVLIMSVKGGFGGQKFNELALEKIKKLDEMRVYDKTPFRICVDGGINEENISKVRAAGADEVVIGAYFFKENLRTHYQKLEKASYGNE